MLSVSILGTVKSTAGARAGTCLKALLAVPAAHPRWVETSGFEMPPEKEQIVTECPAE
jgi:hypothetical protein